MLVSGAASPEIVLYNWIGQAALRIQVPEEGDAGFHLYDDGKLALSLTAAPSLTLRAKEGDTLQYRAIKGRFVRRVVTKDGKKTFEFPMRRER